MTPVHTDAPYCHPLFDEFGFYRAATEDSIWSDYGDDSIRRFINELRRLREAIEGGNTPRDADPLSAGESRSERYAVPDLPQVYSAGAEAAVVDLSESAADRAIGEPEPLAGYAGTTDGHPAFTLRRVIGKPNRLIAMLIFVPPLVRTIAARIGETRVPETIDASLAVLAAALRDEALATTGDEDALRAACDLSRAIAAAPTVIGATDTRGVFEASVELDEPCPRLPDGSVVLFCVGPEVVIDE